MSSRPGTAPTMQRRRRKAAAGIMLASLLVGTAGRALAQQSPPDLRMLMNLDLFEPRNNGVQPAAAPTDDSLLDQIRTLDQMGYLGHQAGAQPGSGAPAPSAGPRSASAPDAEDAAPPPMPAAQEPPPPMRSNETPSNQMPSNQMPSNEMPKGAPAGDVEGPLP